MIRNLAVWAVDIIAALTGKAIDKFDELLGGDDE